jgi:hypothetical protein
METKKRHVPDDSEASLPKKRALVDPRGSPTPHVNGHGSDMTDEPKDDNVEVRARCAHTFGDSPELFMSL